jgi:hypothetical protein
MEEVPKEVDELVWYEGAEALIDAIQAKVA